MRDGWREVRGLTKRPGPTLATDALTLLAGGALAQLLPLLLGPVLTRLFTPQAFGVFTQFTTIAATLAVVASLRYEQALPMALDDEDGAALLALALRVLLVAIGISVPLAWALHAGGWLPLPVLLPLALAGAGLLQVLMLWANRARRFRALAISRVLQYGGGALLQLLAGLLLWQGAPSGVEGAWALVAAPLVAQWLALACLLRPAPRQGWGHVLAPAGAALRARMKAMARRFKDFAWVNSPHAFLGTAQDAVAVALIIAWAGDPAAGFWGLALRYLKAPATLIGSAVSQALYPRLAAAALPEGRRMVRQVMALLGACALALALLLVLAGPWLFAMVFGPSWREAGELARALSPYIGAHFVAAPLAVVTMAWGAQRWAFRVALVGQLVFTVALAAGLHWGGLVGGGWAVSAAMLPYFGYYFWRLAHWTGPVATASANGQGSAA